MPGFFDCWTVTNKYVGFGMFTLSNVLVTKMVKVILENNDTHGSFSIS